VAARRGRPPGAVGRSRTPVRGGDVRGHEPARDVRGVLRAGERERRAGGPAVKREEMLLR
jgi:hypothetical protein